MALALDLKLKTKNGSSLREVMQAMNAEFGALKKGYTKADFIRICEETYGESLQDFFHQFVETTTDITADLQGILESAGLQFAQDITKGWTLIEKHAF